MKKHAFVRFITVTHTIMSLYPTIPQSYDWPLELAIEMLTSFASCAWLTSIFRQSQIFLRCIRADLYLIMNAEHFAQIDRIDQIFDYECNHCEKSTSRLQQPLSALTLWVTDVKTQSPGSSYSTVQFVIPHLKMHACNWSKSRHVTFIKSH